MDRFDRRWYAGFPQILRLWLIALASTSLVIASCVQSPGSKGLVVGGISRCDAHGVPGPMYVAGSVTVYRGHVTWRSIGSGNSQAVFPSDSVATQTVSDNGLYQFTLDPGDYVLRGRYTSGNVQPFIAVTVKSGSTTRADIPNQCI